MPGPGGNYDAIIQAIMAQQGGGPEQPQLAGAADTYSMPGPGAPLGQGGMATPEQRQLGQLDMQQAVKLQQALAAMRRGR